MSEEPLIINLLLCKGCGLCYGMCPTNAISGNDGGKVTLSKPENCIKCGICEDHCPDYAIEVDRL